MTTFLTVREAARIANKSVSSIRRIIHPIVRSDDHPDRALVQPSVEEAVQLRLKGESFAWRISEDLLRRSTRVDDAAPESKMNASHSDGALIAMLQRELDIKNGQIHQQSELIGKQMQLIEGLSERLREGNVLIGGLQQQLALPHPTARQAAQSAHVVTPSAKAPKDASKPPSKKRRRWFSW